MPSHTKSTKKNSTVSSIKIKHTRTHHPLTTPNNEWILPIQTNFKNFITQYIQKTPILSTTNDPNFTYSRTQALVQLFLNCKTPYRGLLLYYALGTGKSCASIAVAEACNYQTVYFFSAAALEDNFIMELKKCGGDTMRTQQHWTHYTPTQLKTHPELLTLAKNFNLKPTTEAVWLPDTNKPPNYNSLTLAQRNEIDTQIDTIIHQKYIFYHLNDSRLLNKLVDINLDNSLVIIDEIHNLSNTMASTTSKKADYLYQTLLHAKNTRYIFLSGTPIINRVFEMSRLYNILAGLTDTLEFYTRPIKGNLTPVDINTIRYALERQPRIHFVDIDANISRVRCILTPEGFICENRNTYSVKLADKTNIKHLANPTTLAKVITNILTKVLNYKMTEPKHISAELLPTNEIVFNENYYDANNNQLLNTDDLSARILGLTSYYGFQNKDAYPTLILEPTTIKSPISSWLPSFMKWIKQLPPNQNIPVNLVVVPLSKYQITTYERYRFEEIQHDAKLARKKTDIDTDFVPTFRLKSRLTSTFTFPKELGAPFDKIDPSLTDEPSLDNLNKIYLARISKARATYLDIKNGNLDIYAPKYSAIIKNIKLTNGKILVYSMFKSLIGLNTFSQALEHNEHYTEFKIKWDKELHQWTLDFEPDKSKKYYIFYTGNEPRNIREIYRLIYNSQWDLLPSSSCQYLIEQIKKYWDTDNNLYGNVIQCLMTTRAGAEGLNLMGVRQVHIMEPHWQPVLIDQIVGRAVRFKSHLNLPERDRNVTAFIYISAVPLDYNTSFTNSKVKTNDICKIPNDILGKYGHLISSDEYLFILANKKRLITSQVELLMKNTAFDCETHLVDNKKADNRIKCYQPSAKTLVNIAYFPAVYGLPYQGNIGPTQIKLVKNKQLLDKL